MAHQSPRQHGPDSPDGVLAQRQAESITRCEPCSSIEVCRITKECRSSSRLNEPSNAYNLCATKIDAFEAIEVGGALVDGLLEVVCDLDLSQRLIDDRCWRARVRESLENMESVLRLALADKPPW
jgi:hypothetical protein